MCSLFKRILLAVIMLLNCLSVFAESEFNSTLVSGHSCHFYEFIEDSDKLSDPANQAIYFINKNWIMLENDLARGQGETLTYLRNLALCNYVLPDNLWKNQLKGLAYQERIAKFHKLFFSECFCSR
jgi:hypothetical protein